MLRQRVRTLKHFVDLGPQLASCIAAAAVSKVAVKFTQSMHVTAMTVEHALQFLQQTQHAGIVIDRSTDLGLTALSAQISYRVPLTSMLQLKSEINWRKLTMLLTCWEYMQ